MIPQPPARGPAARQQERRLHQACAAQPEPCCGRPRRRCRRPRLARPGRRCESAAERCRRLAPGRASFPPPPEFSAGGRPWKKREPGGFTCSCRTGSLLWRLGGLWLHGPLGARCPRLAAFSMFVLYLDDFGSVKTATSATSSSPASRCNERQAYYLIGGVDSFVPPSTWVKYMLSNCTAAQWRTAKRPRGRECRGWSL